MYSRPSTTGRQPQARSSRPSTIRPTRPARRLKLSTTGHDSGTRSSSGQASLAPATRICLPFHLLECAGWSYLCFVLQSLTTTKDKKRTAVFLLRPKIMADHFTINGNGAIQRLSLMQRLLGPLTWPKPVLAALVAYAFDKRHSDHMREEIKSLTHTNAATTQAANLQSFFFEGCKFSCGPVRRNESMEQARGTFIKTARSGFL